MRGETNTESLKAPNVQPSEVHLVWKKSFNFPKTASHFQLSTFWTCIWCQILVVLSCILLNGAWQIFYLNCLSWKMTISFPPFSQKNVKLLENWKPHQMCFWAILFLLDFSFFLFSSFYGCLGGNIDRLFGLKINIKRKRQYFENIPKKPGWPYSGVRTNY